MIVPQWYTNLEEEVNDDDEDEDEDIGEEVKKKPPVSGVKTRGGVASS